METSEVFTESPLPLLSLVDYDLIVSQCLMIKLVNYLLTNLFQFRAPLFCGAVSPPDFVTLPHVVGGWDICEKVFLLTAADSNNSIHVLIYIYV